MSDNHSLEALVRRCETALRWAATQNRAAGDCGDYIRIKRPDGSWCCPGVLALAPDALGGMNPYAVRDGFSENMVSAIMAASDNQRSHIFFSAAIRQRLLTAAGLSR